MNMPFEQVIRLLLNEAFLFRKAIIGTFVVVSLLFLAIGLVWPKIYTATATVLVENTNIINPLMAGTAVTANISERIRIAREILFSRRIMKAILEEGGWMDSDPDLLKQEQLIEELQQKTTISSLSSNLLKIEYQDDTPERTFVVTKKYVDMFIKGSAVEKEQESRKAFEFIDTQVRDYHDKLISVEAKLKEFRSENPDARPGSEAAVNDRINRLLNTVETTALEIQEERIKKASLERQLSGEAEISVGLSREGQLRTRIGELQVELEGLLLTYHESYPDVVRIRQQIRELKAVIKKDKELKKNAKGLARGGNGEYIDEVISNSPLYQMLRSQLSESKTNIETLSARLEESKKRMDTEMNRARRIHGGEAAMTEFTRDYQVNREIYQDLLRRRENARVSLNLNLDREDTAIRIQEPPVMPVKPSGFRFLHFVITGLVMGFLIPLGVLYGIQQIDPRIRVKHIINEKLQLPVIAEIPHLSSPAEIQTITHNSRSLAMVIAGVGVIYIVVSVVKSLGII